MEKVVLQAEKRDVSKDEQLAQRPGHMNTPLREQLIHDSRRQPGGDDPRHPLQLADNEPEQHLGIEQQLDLQARYEREYGKYNITANLIGPGSIEVIRTPGQEVPGGEGAGIESIPIPRQGTVDECTATVVFLASERAGYITGQTFLVNGGAYFL